MSAPNNDNVVADTPTTTCPLSTLLQWAEPLHRANNNLSLLQLIPVHQSLLQALLKRGNPTATATIQQDQSATATTTDDDNVSPFRPWCASTAEARVCQIILARADEDEDVSASNCCWGTYLLVVQYLLVANSNNNKSTGNSCQLWWILWDYLEQHNALFFPGATATTTTRHDNRKATYDGQEMDLFIQAIVQVVLFNDEKASSAIKDIRGWIGEPKLDQAALYWQRTALFLVEWSKTNHSVATETCEVLVPFFEKSLDSVWNSVLINTTDYNQGKDSAGNLDKYLQILPQTAAWKALTQLLLPALSDLLQQEQQQQQELVEHLAPSLWKTVWGFWKTNTIVAERPLLMLFVTTVLCPIFPQLTKQPQLPILQNDGTVYSISQPLIKQLDVWDFLKDCLQQGIDVFTTTRSNQSLAAYRAVSTLIRRRGLFLLRTMAADQKNMEEWSQFVACFETLEMEEDKHLVGQVWSTVGTLTAKASSQRQSSPMNPPLLTMEWIDLLLGHALISADLPFLRKENLYRFFRGQTGYLVPLSEQETSQGKPKLDLKTKTPESGAPLCKLSFDFVWNIIVPAYDTLEQSVGLHVHWVVNGKTEKHDVAAAFDHFFIVYMENMMQRKSGKEWLGQWLSSCVMTQLRAKTVAYILDLTANILNSHGQRVMDLPIQSKDIGVFATNFASMMYTSGRFIPVFRATVLESLAAILVHVTTVGKDDPGSMLRLLELFPYPQDMEEDNYDGESHWIDTDPIFAKLGCWIRGLVRKDPSWTSLIPSTLASAFVDGMMTESGEAMNWTPGTRRKKEHSISRSLVILCALTASQGSISTGSQMLWPAINKGLSLTPSVLVGASEKNSKRVERAAVLLEHGCKVQILSGNGNGDLVVDRQTQQMMPPPPSVEKLLSHAVSFLLYKIQALLLPCGDEKYGSRSSETRALSAKCAGYLETLRTLHQGYPSSSAVSKSANDSLRLGLKEIGGKEKISVASIQYLVLVFAALCCGADTEINVEGTCRTLSQLGLDATEEMKGAIEPVKSVFEYSRWGTLANILPRLSTSSHVALFEQVLHSASSTVQKCPIEALMPLFESAITTGRFLISHGVANKALVHLKRLISVLTKVIEKCERGRKHLFVIDESARLLFQHALLLDEYDRLQKDKKADTPVRDAFRKLVKSAGQRRAHILRTVLSRIIPAWMKRDNTDAGQLAIPYRDDIVRLLMFKEERLELSMQNRSDLDAKEEDDKARPPQAAHELSLVRGFILAFLSSLPESSSIGEDIRVNLVNYIITTLLEKVKIGKNSLSMIGTPAFCGSHRGWQALCILSKYVEDDIAEEVCKGVFEAMDEQMHGQTRFFLEVFTIQCARKHPLVFGKALCENLLRHDLHLQIVASLMIVTGHLIIGKYKADFLPFLEPGGERHSSVALDQLLAGSIPWLSSTQGFSRAIAQILVHGLIPIAIDVNNDSVDGNDWYLRSIYSFLENNNEMKRLRKKQQKFFDNIDVDLYCSLEGCLSVRVDDVGEAYPIHMIDIIKTTLSEVYEEAHGADVPTWKQVKSMIEEAEEAEGDGEKVGESLLNFQRKIIPLDALNIALDEHREKRFRNAAGRKKQPLIVCASLVDKVPNLGGLARTSEIFAADRLVVPDKKVMKMDNFTAISVSAGDWIEIEECGEKDLLRWLRARKMEGWFVLGIEQTSSSMSMTEWKFPNRPTILLLGKEKEGIPVQYLQAVDQCVEIPQLGIIRSLNVHVTGALAIWEYTRQRMEAHVLQ